MLNRCHANPEHERAPKNKKVVERIAKPYGKAMRKLTPLITYQTPKHCRARATHAAQKRAGYFPDNVVLAMPFIGPRLIRPTMRS